MDTGGVEDFRYRKSGMKMLALTKKRLHVQAGFQQGLCVFSKMCKAKVRISHGDKRDFRDSGTQGIQRFSDH